MLAWVVSNFSTSPQQSSIAKFIPTDCIAASLAMAPPHLHNQTQCITLSDDNTANSCSSHEMDFPQWAPHATTSHGGRNPKQPTKLILDMLYLFRKS